METASPREELAVLLLRVRNGDEDALTLVLQHYEPRIRTAARVLLSSLMRPQMDSLDLVQSVHRVLLPVLREGKYEVSDLDQLVALAITLIRRKIARNWRRMRREIELQTQAREQGTMPGAALSSPPADPAEEAQLKDLLQHLLAHMDEKDRKLVELRLEGHSTAEIAAQMGCNSHALRARLSRLRQHLRSLGYTAWV